MGPCRQLAPPEGALRGRRSAGRMERERPSVRPPRPPPPPPPRSRPLPARGAAPRRVAPPRPPRPASGAPGAPPRAPRAPARPPTPLPPGAELLVLGCPWACPGPPGPGRPGCRGSGEGLGGGEAGGAAGSARRRVQEPGAPPAPDRVLTRAERAPVLPWRRARLRQGEAGGAGAPWGDTCSAAPAGMDGWVPRGARGGGRPRAGERARRGRGSG